jgi:hypothetical protein
MLEMLCLGFVAIVLLRHGQRRGELRQARLASAFTRAARARSR